MKAQNVFMYESRVESIVHGVQADSSIGVNEMESSGYRARPNQEGHHPAIVASPSRQFSYLTLEATVLLHICDSASVSPDTS